MNFVGRFINGEFGFSGKEDRQPFQGAGSVHVGKRVNIGNETWGCDWRGYSDPFEKIKRRKREIGRFERRGGAFWKVWNQSMRKMPFLFLKHELPKL